MLELVFSLSTVLAAARATEFMPRDERAAGASVPLVVRSYDIAGTTGWRAPPRVGERVFPVSFAPTDRTQRASSYAEPGDWAPDLEHVVYLVQDVFGPEFESAGRRIWSDGTTSRLYVRAPEPVQREIQELLTALEAACVAPAEI